MELVSIIMPAYNAESYIKDSIDSVLSQTHTNFELIVVDDCSKDKTVQVLRSLNDPRIKIVELKENVGTGDARNCGLQVSQGQYISFIDADDVWLPQKLELQLKHMQQTKAPISHTSYSFINETGEQISGYVQASSTVDLSQYMRSTEIGLSTAMIDRQQVGGFTFNSMRLRQDTRLWIDLMMRGFCSKGLDKTLVNYRIRSGQISGNKFKSAFRTLKLYLSIHELPLPQRLLSFSCYILNAVLKRFRHKSTAALVH